MCVYIFIYTPVCVVQENCVYETVVPPLDDDNFTQTVTPIFQEYFEHGDTNEVAVRKKGALISANVEVASSLSC